MTAGSWNDAPPDRVHVPVQLHPGGMPTYVEYIRADLVAEGRMAIALASIAEWAETADSVEAVNGLAQTAKIARDALGGRSRNR